MNDVTNSEVFSLADLADFDATEVAEIRFENLPAGLYGFKVVNADLGEKDNRDGDNRVIAEFKLEVVEVASVVKKGIDPETLMGKGHTEKVYIVPDQGQGKAIEGIGRVKAFIADMGVNATGTLAEMVASTVDHVFNAKITEKPNPNDKSQPYAQLKFLSKGK